MGNVICVGISIRVLKDSVRIMSYAASEGETELNTHTQYSYTYS